MQYMRPKYFLIVKHKNSSHDSFFELFSTISYDSLIDANKEIKNIKENHNIELYALKI